jgi:c-di-GMP-binding flagellar brake protein YcgR
MGLDNIKTGDRIEISYITDTGHETILLSKVEVVLDDDNVVIHAPVWKSKIVKLPKERGYSMVFVTETAMYRYDGRVLSYQLVDGFSVMTMHLTGDGEKVQRRNFFRFSCLIPVSFAIINEQGEQLEQGLQNGVIIDISGGGIRFVSQYNMPLKSLVRATMQLGGEYIMIFGQVLQRKHTPNTLNPYQYSLKFAAISNAEQERIIQYIYAEQRKSLLR